MFVVAFRVDAVATDHEYDGFGGGEHVLPADGTIAVRRSLDAFVGGLNRYRNACAACLFHLYVSGMT